MLFDFLEKPNLDAAPAMDGVAQVDLMPPMCLRGVTPMFDGDKINESGRTVQCCTPQLRISTGGPVMVRRGRCDAGHRISNLDRMRNFADKIRQGRNRPMWSISVSGALIWGHAWL